MSLSPLTCRWVPGTFDRVLVSSPFGHGEASLRDVRRVLGPGAVHDLYLRGRHRHFDDEDRVWYAMLCLGCLASPDEPAPVAAPSPSPPPAFADPAGGRA